MSWNTSNCPARVLPSAYHVTCPRPRGTGHFTHHVNHVSCARAQRSMTIHDTRLSPSTVLDPSLLLTYHCSCNYKNTLALRYSLYSSPLLNWNPAEAMSSVIKNQRERERVKIKRKALEELQQIVSNTNLSRIRRPDKRWTEQEILKNTYIVIKALEYEARIKGLELPPPPMTSKMTRMCCMTEYNIRQGGWLIIIYLFFFFGLSGYLSGDCFRNILVVLYYPRTLPCSCPVLCLKVNYSYQGASIFVPVLFHACWTNSHDCFLK